MSSGAARYDGHAEWYDQSFSALQPADELAFLRQGLGAGHGQVCLDLACGTGRYGPSIAAAGYRSAGFDISADQLRLARRRLDAVVRADAGRLPVRDASVPVVAGLYFHTDLADFAAVAREVARCLRPGGRFIYLGLHPCFIGPFSNRMNESAESGLHFSAGYGHVGWADRASGDGSGLGGRVGFHHKTLESFLGAILNAGLSVRALQEFSGGGVILPRNIGLVAEK